MRQDDDRRALQEYWSRRGDGDLEDAAKSLRGYTEPAQAVIRAELAQRGLHVSSLPAQRAPLNALDEARPSPPYPRDDSPGVSKCQWLSAALISLWLIHPDATTVLFAISALFLGSLAFVGAGTARSYAQLQRNQLARDMINSLMNGEEVPSFFLYLKPFSLTREIKLLNPRRLPVPLNTTFFEPRYLHLEAVFSNAFVESVPTLTLAEPDNGGGPEPLGAGRLSIEDREWKQQVRRLINRAHGILVVPADSDGLSWELSEIIAQDRLHRCIFIMPPSSARRQMQSENAWQAATTKLAHEGLVLPEYSRWGLLFSLQRDGSICNAERLDVISERRFRESIHRLFHGDRCRFASLAEEVMDGLGLTSAGRGQKQLAEFALSVVNVFLALAFMIAVMWAAVRMS